jgi:hypothetical protein
MTAHQPEPPSAFGCLGAIMGALLLLPGLCSALVTLDALRTPQFLGPQGLMLWSAGFMFGALGIYLIIRAFRR